MASLLKPFKTNETQRVPAYEPIVGIDIGGSGIKAARVDIATGELVSERVRYDTPDPSKPDAVVDILHKLVSDLEIGEEPVGLGFPGIVKGGVARSAANLHKDWSDADLHELVEPVFGKHAYFLNDADAAGLAEVRFGETRNKEGLVLMITVGTGIGTALFHDGQLLPNKELGHLLINPKSRKSAITVENWASNDARKKADLKWKDWAGRLNEVLQAYDFYLCPDHFILGGGAAKRYEKFAMDLDQHFSISCAHLGNHAGMIGAACHAQESVKPSVA